MQALGDATALRELSRRTVLHMPGDDAEHVYCLHGGRVCVLRESTTCRTINLGDFGPGDIFGESCVWTPAPREDTAITTAAALLSMIPRVALRLVLDEYPEAERTLVAQSMARRDATTRRLCDALSLSVRARLAGQILRLAEGGRNTMRGRELVISIRHHELAALVVSTRETVSLELQRLERDRLIARVGRQIVVPDLRQLRAAAREDRPPEQDPARAKARSTKTTSTRGARAP
ncbi:Crp/Fnr family transcriptional regulator [Nannocystis bainbridge]|uniref:Crp/Fnr family transcriptional regulator n=1 Tax=Nannocystis bainbridge TaxID=2995303 RepID=A0ABT5EAL0_9BACT|nr:Crp/Fnr family transcriptional regulator [Nannocystis bainbridge]MDC0722488.1 Crp/Fnr family transcriptional regulator [Nannocystis bainbridge]